jgi:hypothetical protein
MADRAPLASRRARTSAKRVVVSPRELSRARDEFVGSRTELGGFQVGVGYRR